MDVVMLPLTRHETSVADALALLQTYRRAGVVRANPDDTFDLVFAGGLLAARAAGQKLVGQVERARPIAVVEPPIAADFRVDLVRPLRTALAFERLLDAVGTHFGLVGESPDAVMLVTRHEGETALLTTTGGFECTGTPTHFFPEPRVSVGDPCPLYPACFRSDGTMPVIRPA